MQYKVALKPNAAKQFEKLPERDQTRILQGLDELRADPWIGKKLQGPLAGFFSHKIWPYRIIYSIEKKKIMVTVVAIGDRKDIYK